MAGRKNGRRPKGLLEMQDNWRNGILAERTEVGSEAAPETTMMHSESMCI